MSGPEATAGLPWSVTGDAVIITVRLTPRGGRDAIEGIERLADGRAVLKVRVRAAPSDGAANAALLALLAKQLKVAGRRVALAAGDTARIKRVRIDGDARELAAMVAALQQYAAAPSH